MLMQYGARPAVYGPCVRVAWLRLQLGEYDESVAVYQRAMALDAMQYEARVGLSLALTGQGYRALNRGDYPAARRAWEEALVHEPLRTDAQRGLTMIGRTDEIAPELWVGRVSATQNSSATNVTYAQLPVRFTPWFSARGAVRRVSSPSSAPNTEAFFGSQTEFFGALQVERGPTATQLAAFHFRNLAASNTGGAAQWRVGGHQGFTLLGSFIQTDSGSNVQVSPVAFRWVSPTLKVSVGTRFTSDSALNGVSGLAGVTWIGKEATVDFRLHAGRERWAFDMAGPTVLSFLAETSAGATATASVPFGPELTFSLQAQLEKTKSDKLGSGRYTSISLGVRYAPLASNR